MRAILVAIAGAFMILSSLAHGFAGWPAMRAELEKASASANLVGGLAAGWLFGSATMATFGAIAVVAALRLRRGDRSGVFAVRAVSACYVIFGLSAFALRKGEPFFLHFVAVGMLAVAPTLGGAREGVKSSHDVAPSGRTHV